jgi:uncharacterized protein with beta-barrel porin domain
MLGTVSSLQPVTRAVQFTEFNRFWVKLRPAGGADSRSAVRRTLLSGTAFAIAIFALALGNPQSAVAQCAVLGAPAGPYTVDCATTTTTNTTNTDGALAASSDREQLFNNNSVGYVSATVASGATISGFGLAIVDTNAGSTVSVLNNGTVSVTGANSPNPTTSGGDVLDLAGTNITYNGNGSVLDQSTGSVGWGLNASSGSGNIVVGSVTPLSGNYSGGSDGAFVLQTTSGNITATIASGTYTMGDNGYGDITFFSSAATGTVTATIGAGTTLLNTGGTTGVVAGIYSNNMASASIISSATIGSATNPFFYGIAVTGKASSTGTGTVTVTQLGNVFASGDALGPFGGPAGIWVAETGNATINFGNATTTPTMTVTKTGGTSYGIITSGAASGNTQTVNVFGMIATPDIGVSDVQTTAGANSVVNVMATATITANDIGVQARSTGAGTTSITNSGTISAVTGIVVSNGSPASVFDSGTIIGTGGTAVDLSGNNAGDVNTFTLGPGYSITGLVKGEGSDIFQLGGTGTGSFNLSTIGPTQQYEGFTTLNVISGTWTASNAFSQTSPWTVEGGSLILSGDLSKSSLLTVDSGATLEGTGAAGNTQINTGGMFAPGTPGVPGTFMTINGNLAFQSGALYLVSLNGTTSTSASVSGTASLAGTVSASFASGSYISKVYPILSAGSVTGSFGALKTTNLPSNFTASLSYDTAHAYLDLALSFTPVYTPLNVNENNVANALINYFNTTGGIPMKFGTLTSSGLTAVDGEAATGAERGAFQMMDQFLALMLDPFVDGRSGGGTAMGFTADEQASLPPDIALAYAGVLKAPPMQNFDQLWSAWGAGFGGSSTTDGNAAVGSNNVTASDYGFAAGMDYHAAPNTVLGFALAGGGTNWGLAQGLGGGRSDAFQAGVYGTTYFGPAYFAAAFAFTNNWMTTNRIALGDQLTASFDGQSFGLHLESGYRYAVPIDHAVIGVTPYAALQAQSFYTPSYSETDVTGGGFGLNYNARECNGHEERTGRAVRRSDLARRHAAGAARACRLGARLGQQSRARRGIRIAARRELYRQRRAGAERLRARLGRRGVAHDCQLDVRRKIRRRVRQLLADLCWLRHAALYVVRS